MRVPGLILFCWLGSACHLVIDLEKQDLPVKEVETCSGTDDCNDGHDCTEDMCELPEGRCKHYVMPADTLCREKREEDVCDVASEYCDGTSHDCPDDSFEPESMECRSSEGQCDEAEYCTGSSPECPENAFSPPEKACDDGIDCTYDDRCDGHGECGGINGLHDVEQMSIGPWALFTCALLSTGEMRCWGINNYGNLGDGTRENRFLPTLVVGLPEGQEIAAITPGGRHTCVLFESGRIMCWGMGTNGALGNGSFYSPEEDGSPTPVEVTEITDGWRLVFAATYHTCAIQENDRAYCWGENEYGNLGNGTFEDSAVPGEVTGLAEVSSIAGGYHHTCAIDSSGNLLCWGRNDRGQLGNPDAADSSPTPVEVEGIPSRVSAVVPGTFHTCALLENGEVMCWGGNDYGELGIGDIGDSDVPVAVSGLPSAALKIASGDKHTCAVLDGGEVWCWGSNNDGQIGDGTKGEDRFLPVKVAGLSSDAGVVSIATGAFHTCVLLENETIKCWGDNVFGQFGDGTQEGSLEPVEAHCQ